MKNLLVVLLFILPGILNAQTEEQTGIHFENLAGWAAIKAKAKQENKYIFLDCFATWCAPCKKMDKDVYPVDSIGKFFNEHFVSVKVQMDSTALDNEAVRAWYADAHFLQQAYKIAAFPSYLFFSPDGKAVHKNIGFMAVSDFSLMAHNALNPQKQYYTRRESFQLGKLPNAEMPNLSRAARRIQDTAVANAVSQAYINTYLLQLPEKDLYTPENIEFIAEFIRGSQDKAFDLFYSHAGKVDSAVKAKNYARNNVDFILEREEINQLLYSDGKPFKLRTGDAPDWKKIQRKIEKKYNLNYAERVVLWAKIKWLEYKKDWPEYSRNVIIKVERDGPYIKQYPYIEFSWDVLLNASAWEIFSYSTNHQELEKALEWSDKIIKSKPAPDYFDTYANILYKLGRTEEALTFEEKAVALNPNNREISDNLARIKKGEPTWPTK